MVEFDHDPGDPIRSALLMPLAAGECHVDLPGGHVHKAYVGNVVTGLVTVLEESVAISNRLLVRMGWARKSSRRLEFLGR